MTKVKNIEFMQNIKIVYEEEDENSEDKGNKLILLDCRDSMWEGGMWERRDNSNLSFLVSQLKKATCLLFCSSIVVIYFTPFYMAYSVQLFHWKLFSKELFKSILLMLQSLYL